MLRRLAQARATRRSSVTFVVASACMLAQLGMVAHDILARHVVCAEHGEMLDAVAPDRRAPSEETKARPVLARSSREAAQAHDHCLVVSTRQRSKQVEDGATASGPSRSASKVGIASREASWKGPIALLALAPKISPPA
jgi:hypothetical protein